MRSLKKQILYCTLGTSLEWYDFSLFASMAVLLSHIFFPKTDHALIYTFVIFASGFIMRPLGAIFFGHFGDKIGRKATLLLTIILMALSTTIIGMIPKETVFSTWLLVICRLIQGFAASGEYGGGITLLYEQPSNKKGFISSFGLFAAILGIFFGSSIVAIISTLISHEKMIEWGWRVPFILGAPLGLFGYFLRKSLLESEEFEVIKSKNHINKIPLKQLIVTYKVELIFLLNMYILANVSFYINFIYLSNFILNRYHSNHQIYIRSFSTLIYALSILAFGLISDYIEKKKIMFASCILMIMFTYSLFNLAIYGGSFLAQFIAQSTISILIGMFVGPLAAVSAECFSTNVRYSGIGIPLNLSSSIFGGTTPLICAWFVNRLEDPIAPAYYFLLCVCIALATLICLLKRNRQLTKNYLTIVNSV